MRSHIDINTTYFIWFFLKPVIIRKLVTCQRITSKKYSTSMGRHRSPRYGQVILVSGYPVLTAVNWSQHGCATSGCTWASKLVRKCEIKYWFPYGAFGRSVKVRWLPNFLGWVDLLSYGAPPTRAWSSTIKAHLITSLLYYCNFHALSWTSFARAARLIIYSVSFVPSGALDRY